MKQTLRQPAEPRTPSGYRTAPLGRYLEQIKLPILHIGWDQSEVETQLTMALEGKALAV